jgi:hypothetical protein
MGLLVIRKNNVSNLQLVEHSCLHKSFLYRRLCSVLISTLDSRRSEYLQINLRCVLKCSKRKFSCAVSHSTIIYQRLHIHADGSDGCIFDKIILHLTAPLKSSLFYLLMKSLETIIYRSVTFQNNENICKA